eukprot:5913365-Amphidinium_carterae.1
MARCFAALPTFSSTSTSCHRHPPNLVNCFGVLYVHHRLIFALLAIFVLVFGAFVLTVVFVLSIDTASLLCELQHRRFGAFVAAVLFE